MLSKGFMVRLVFQFLLNFILFAVSCSLVFIPTSASAAGSQKIDSLQKELVRTDAVEDKIKIYLAVADAFSKRDLDSAIYFNRMALNLAKRLKTEIPLADAYNQAAKFAIWRNKLDQAFLDLTLARMYYQSGDNMEGYMWTTALLGNIQLSHDNISGAMTYYMEVIGMLENRKDPRSLLPKMLNSVGSIFMESEDYNTAISYITRALSLFRKEKNLSQTVYPLMNLGEIYFSLGNMDMSEEYIDQTIEVAREIRDKMAESRGLMILGKIRTRASNFPEAITMLDSSLAIQEGFTGKYDGPKDIQYSELLVQLGETWRLSGNDQRAFFYSHKGLFVARSMKQINQESLAVKQLSMLHEGRSDSDSALYYYKIYLSLSEELAKARNIRAVKLMEIRQDFARKQRENETNIARVESARRNMLILYIFSGAGFILIILVLVLKLKLEKQRKRESENEKTGLKEKLEYQNKELMTNVMYLTRMNELVLVIAEKLNHLEMKEGSSNDTIVQSIIQELKQTTNNESWKDFEVRFQQVHIDFYKKLSEKFADLSPNDLKMCAFLRLNLSTKEISSITHQSQDSIRMARSRLRQKLGVTKDDNLVTFLTQI